MLDGKFVVNSSRSERMWVVESVATEALSSGTAQGDEMMPKPIGFRLLHEGLCTGESGGVIIARSGDSCRRGVWGRSSLHTSM